MKIGPLCWILVWEGTFEAWVCEDLSKHRIQYVVIDFVFGIVFFVFCFSFLRVFVEVREGVRSPSTSARRHSKQAGYV